MSWPEPVVLLTLAPLPEPAFSEEPEVRTKTGPQSTRARAKAASEHGVESARGVRLDQDAEDVEPAAVGGPVQRGPLTPPGVIDVRPALQFAGDGCHIPALRRLPQPGAPRL